MAGGGHGFSLPLHFLFPKKPALWKCRAGGVKDGSENKQMWDWHQPGCQGACEETPTGEEIHFKHLPISVETNSRFVPLEQHFVLPLTPLALHAPSPEGAEAIASVEGLFLEMLTE